MYRIDFEQFKANMLIDLSRYSKRFTFKSKKGASKDSTYIPANRMLTLLREYYPAATPLLASYEALPDNGSIVLQVVLDWGELGQSPVMCYPVMNHGIGAHGAVSLPDSREFVDSLSRAFAKLISYETGLGWDQWLEESDPEEQDEEAQPHRRRRSQKEEFDFDDPTPTKAKTKKRWVEEDEEDDEEEDAPFDTDEEEEEEEERPAKRPAKRPSASRFRRRS